MYVENAVDNLSLSLHSEWKMKLELNVQTKYGFETGSKQYMKNE